MKRYIRSSWENYNPSQSESGIVNQYVKYIKKSLMGYTYTDKGVPYLNIPDISLSVISIDDIKTKVSIWDASPYTKKITISGIATLDDNINNHPAWKTSGDVYDRTYKRVFNKMASSIVDIIEDGIPDSFCDCVLYANAVGFEVVIELK